MGSLSDLSGYHGACSCQRIITPPRSPLSPGEGDQYQLNTVGFRDSFLKKFRRKYSLAVRSISTYCISIHSSLYSLSLSLSPSLSFSLSLSLFLPLSLSPSLSLSVPLTLSLSLSLYIYIYIYNMYVENLPCLYYTLYANVHFISCLYFTHIQYS